MLRISIILFTLFIFLNVSAQSHWEAIVLANENWRYFPATTEAPTDWNMSTFDDSQWQIGVGGIGYSDGDDATVISAVNSLYLRKEINIINIADILECHLDIDYDDGFVAYINGVEIARSFNVSDPEPSYNSILTIDHEASMYSGGEPDRFVFDKSVLQNGRNTLAIHIINVGIGSSDLSSVTYMNALINTNDIQYNSPADYFTTPVSFETFDLPIIKINTSGQSIPDEPKITVQMSVINNSNGINHPNDSITGYNGYIGIELRGSSSLSFDKKGFGVETRDSLGENNNVSLLGLPEENDWVFNGPYSDKSMMRNALTYYLGSSLGQWAPRTRFCELFINDEYNGVYVLTEKIKRDKNRVNISKLTADEITGDDLTGGYILRIDRVSESWTSPYLAFNNRDNVYINYYEPKYENMPVEQLNYIKNYVTAFEDALNGDDFTDAENGYRKYINVESFVDYYLINELSRNVDAYRLSTYFHKDKDSKGGKLTMGPFWDYNLAFGNANYYDGWNTTGWIMDKIDPNGEFAPPVWWLRLVEDPYFKSELKKRWNFLRQNTLSLDHINSFIDSTATQLENAQKRNFETFPILGNYVWPNAFVGNTYESEIAYLKKWIEDRLAWMDNEIAVFEELGIESDMSVNIQQVRIVPNPFTNHLNFNIELSSKSKIMLNIFNSLGQTVYTKTWLGKLGENEYNLDDLNNKWEKGVYFFHFTTDNNRVNVLKIIKQ